MAMKQGTNIDATLIAVASSIPTEAEGRAWRSHWNKAGKRDSEMHQTKTGNQWYFGFGGCTYSMKVHIGVDKDTGLIHSVETTAANGPDSTTSR
jgi:IS5 family transposase